MRPIGDKLVIASHNPGKLREIARAARAATGSSLRRRRGARPARARGDRHHLRRQCRSEGARGGGPQRLAGARRRQRPVRRRAARAARHLLGALGRGCRRQPRLDARDGARLARDRGDRARRRAATRISSARWRSPGPTTARSKRSKAGSTARWSGRRAATAASATTRCSCRRATSRRSASSIRSSSTHQPPRRCVPQTSRRAWLAAGWRAAPQEGRAHSPGTRRPCSPRANSGRPDNRSSAVSERAADLGRRRPHDLRVMADVVPFAGAADCRGTRRGGNSAPPRPSRRPSSS